MGSSSANRSGVVVRGKRFPGSETGQLRGACRGPDLNLTITARKCCKMRYGMVLVLTSVRAANEPGRPTGAREIVECLLVHRPFFARSGVKPIREYLRFVARRWQTEYARSRNSWRPSFPNVSAAAWLGSPTSVCARPSSGELFHGVVVRPPAVPPWANHRAERALRLNFARVADLHRGDHDCLCKI